jgi:hypothetical protein
MGPLGKLSSTVSTFKWNNLNQWINFSSNPKMFKTLAALALTSWLVTGVYGLPFGDEAEYVGSFMKSLGWVDRTPRELMLEKLPDPVTFGPTSFVPKWTTQGINKASELAGSNARMNEAPAMALHRKFGQDNPIPDDLASFIYPLMTFYTNKFKTGYQYAKSGFADQEGAVLAREMAVGNLKFGVDYLGLTNEQGLTIAPNQINDVSPDHFDRTKQEWKLAAILGVVSQREFRNKTEKFMNKISENAWKESTKSKVSSTISAFNDGNQEKFEKLAQEAIQYNPGAAEEISKYLNSQALARNVPMQAMMEMQFAKKANSKHGFENFLRHKARQETRVD